MFCFSFFLWVVLAVLFLTIASISMLIWLRWGLWVSHLISHDIRWNRSLFKWIACYTTMASCWSLVAWLIGSYKEVYHSLNFCLFWLLWICCCLAIFTSYWLHMWSCNSVNRTSPCINIVICKTATNSAVWFLISSECVVARDHLSDVVKSVGFSSWALLLPSPSRISCSPLGS